MRWKKVALQPFIPPGTPPNSSISDDGRNLSRPDSLPGLDTAPKRPCVLVIDDSATIRKIIEIGLSREGADVISYGDPVEALQAISVAGVASPDMAFVDLGLPKMDGYQVVRHLKARPRFQQMAIIVISERGGTLDRLKARIVGANDYITKPFKIQDMQEVLARYLREERKR